MERRLNGQNFAEMFGGTPPSRKAVSLVEKAISLGEDPTALTQRAGMAAQRDGRSKVGFFGEARKYLENLGEVIASIENRKAMNASLRKPSKR
jgi:hypothetical protein